MHRALTQRVKRRPTLAALLLLLVALVLAFLANQPAVAYQSDDPAANLILSGRVLDPQNQPVVEAELVARASDESEPLGETHSQENGTWQLILSELPSTDLTITIERQHFETATISLAASELRALANRGAVQLGELVLEREISAGFWAATIIFVAVLLIIALERLHSTTAALAGLSAIFLVSVVGEVLWEELLIFKFERALTYINWEVIFLVMAMMIVIAIIEETGIFQWTAFQAYRISRGRAWLLVLILMAVTAVASALLDNFTTMLLMTPISLQIGLALGINPLALIVPEVLASNVGGISTLIGTPTNILIGAHANIGFTDFLINQTVGVLVALALMGGYVLWHYRAEWRAQAGGISPALYARLEENAQIKHPGTLAKSGFVFGLILGGFVLGEQIEVVPAVPALIGATALLIWLQPDIHAMIKAVDWTTLVFFMALFMVVGAVQEVGLISVIAANIGQVVGQSLALAIFIMVFGVGLLSIFIANIPLAASMLPVADFLTGSIPGAEGKALYYALSMGAAMGGNGSLVGAEANLVTAGITEQAGEPMSFANFLKVGIPVTLLTLAAGFLWLLIRFVIL
ncbi:MAG: SLC13 family permease [Candidatus Promineifilaceae bacterium]|nr:SLC13 family permease [Candidatus Promineifilaceae bacterium]